MKKLSAGILLYRKRGDNIEVFLGHPGGPFFAKKDNGFWSLPKGEYEDGEEPYDAAVREFREETGHDVSGEAIPLGSVTRKSGKVIQAWGVEGDADPEKVVSNMVELDWPPRSGKKMLVPEIDRAEWFHIEEARVKLESVQTPFIDRLLEHLENEK
jgi:predicted NUDIX family NTP pyrophosphohydrolase